MINDTFNKMMAHKKPMMGIALGVMMATMTLKGVGIIIGVGSFFWLISSLDKHGHKTKCCDCSCACCEEGKCCK